MKYEVSSAESQVCATPVARPRTKWVQRGFQCRCIYVHTFIYAYNTLLYIYLVYTICIISIKSAFVRSTKPTLQLHNMPYNIAQNILHIHIFWKSFDSEHSDSTEATRGWVRVSHIFWWAYQHVCLGFYKCLVGTFRFVGVHCTHLHPLAKGLACALLLPLKICCYSPQDFVRGLVENQQRKCPTKSGISCSVILVVLVKAQDPVSDHSLKLMWMKFEDILFTVQAKEED